ncbi:barley B recombinant-like protein D [Lactuca sativa]|uniref:GAGA-binding transcriptional activator n=1 Tax=Lactuca sativa TaxID=4236 RepID=A0A9R1W5W9_LACSA|nr:barley B recombinant-like protein D [Lactuca sativa]XP_023749254.1 barley B recombinant-like protein D [Lactuca sativa]XP_023749259.1 barley B recombinant-like protein D [Lactuca sativa]KAJ0216761.1 hypothetical protein LSAT_V11C300130100 [Lactuca sativa]
MDHNHLTIKTFMAIMAERDAAIQERNLALDERKRAFAERDMAMLQRDAALAERNSAMQQRDEAIATLRFQGTNNNNNNNFIISTLPENTPTQGQNRNFTNQEIHHMFEIPNDNTYQVQVQVQSTTKSKSKSPRVRRRRGESVKFTNQEIHHMLEIGEDTYEVEPQSYKTKGVKSPMIGRRRGESVKLKVEEWKDESELNQVSFDDLTMPVPVCSCTGVPQPCYRWGSGGWQSACCTTTMSMYPLPQVSNKKYSRVGGRKMSGGAFSKLLTRLSSEGYDLSTPLDLKEHWAKHGTNRYSTVK